MRGENTEREPGFLLSSGLHHIKRDGIQSTRLLRTYPQNIGRRQTTAEKQSGCLDEVQAIILPPEIRFSLHMKYQITLAKNKNIAELENEVTVVNIRINHKVCQLKSNFM